MFVILGESGSGKSTVINMLVEDCGLRNIVMYTTRPMRKNEMQDKDYHFVDDNTFSTMMKSNMFAAYSYYNGWGYGVANDDCNLAANGVVAVTPHGLRQLRNVLGGDKIKSIYLSVSRRERLVRLLNRGDDVDEAYRRNLSEVGQYDGVEEESDYCVKSDNFTEAYLKVRRIVESIT